MTKPSDLLPDLPGYDPEPADGVRVGESPVPGLTLRRILRGHEDTINRIAWSPDGRFLASCSSDDSIRIWDISHEESIKMIPAGNGVNSIAWLRNSRRIAFAQKDSRIVSWDIEKAQPLWIYDKYEKDIYSIEWSPASNLIALGGAYKNIVLLDAHVSVQGLRPSGF